MDEHLYQSIYQLKELLNSDPRIVSLNKIEKEMMENEEVMILTYKKDEAADKLSEVLRHFKDDSSEAQQARIKLMEAKEKLYSHPVVKAYNKAYAEVRELYRELNKVLFENLNVNMCK